MIHTVYFQNHIFVSNNFAPTINKNSCGINKNCTLCSHCLLRLIRLPCHYKCTLCYNPLESSYKNVLDVVTFPSRNNVIIRNIFSKRNHNLKVVNQNYCGAIDLI